MFFPPLAARYLSLLDCDTDLAWLRFSGFKMRLKMGRFGETLSPLTRTGNASQSSAVPTTGGRQSQHVKLISSWDGIHL